MRTCSILALLSLLLPLKFANAGEAQNAPAQQSSETSEQAQATRGEKLFTGTIRFERGGAPCASCHSVAGLRFPYGGTLGPDLTHMYSKLGEEGVDTALQTLFFPAMTPLYEAHQLTPAEQRDLKVFFHQENSQALPGDKFTIEFLLAALGGFVVLTILAAAFWRDRLRSVRRRLVESASR